MKLKQYRWKFLRKGLRSNSGNLNYILIRDNLGKIVNRLSTLKNKECQSCGISFHPNEKRRKYCSKHCYGIYLKSIGIKPPSRKGQIMPESAKQAIRIFALESGKEPPHPKGEFHPMWKGGETTQKIRKARYESHRRTLKNNNGGSHTYSEWILLKEKLGNICLRCQISGDKVLLCEDHVLPISKSGNDDITNIQPLCKTCNSWKKDKFIDFRNKYYGISL